MIVCSLSQNSAAICLFERPVATRSRISRSRPVRPNSSAARTDSPAAVPNDSVTTFPSKTCRRTGATSTGSIPLLRKALAPRRRASAANSGSSTPESITTFVSGYCFPRRSSSSRPSSPGILMSSRTMSGSVSATRGKTSLPDLASPTISISGSGSSAKRTAWRTSAWSSARRTRICCLVLAMLAERNLDGQTRSMARVGLHGQHAPHSTRSLLDGNGT